MKSYRNISLCQINVVAGQDEYYFPKNSNWNGEQIERILIVAPTVSMVSPVDGKSVLTASQVKDVYLDLYEANDAEICHSLHYSNILNTNNHPFEIDRVLSLSLSRIFFATPPQQSGALLMYIFYNSSNACDEASRENITVRFDLQAGERLSFKDMINRYMYANDKHVKKIVSWNVSSPAFMTLRDVTGMLAFTELSTELFRAPVNGGTADSSQVFSLALNNVDLDFDNCNIHNTTTSDQQHVITFEY